MIRVAVDGWKGLIFTVQVRDTAGHLAWNRSLMVAIWTGSIVSVVFLTLYVVYVLLLKLFDMAEISLTTSFGDVIFKSVFGFKK